MDQSVIHRLSTVAQCTAMGIIALAALAVLSSAALAALGVLPWLELDLRIDGTALPWAGPALQIGFGVLLVLLLMFVPSALRVLKLEARHRDFTVSMDDVVRAYTLAHSADRKRAFTMDGEFDGIRERYNFLRDHPDLPEIDAELMTIAAQMSHQSRDLAAIWSEEKVDRIHAALSARKTDADELQGLIQTAHAHARDIRHRLEDVEMDEASVASQLDMLREDMADIAKRCRKAGIGGVEDPSVSRAQPRTKAPLAAE